jgi:hypothetical protein
VILWTKFWKKMLECLAFLNSRWACLVNHFHSIYFFFHLFQKYQIKIILIFLHFLYHITIQMKTLTTKQFFFYFSIKHSQILYHINHLLLLFKQIFHNTHTYQTIIIFRWIMILSYLILFKVSQEIRWNNIMNTNIVRAVCLWPLQSHHNYQKTYSTSKFKELVRKP